MKLKIVGKISRATDGSAGFDLFAQDDMDLLPNQQMLVKIGIKTAFAKNFVGIIKEKSGNSNKRKLRVHAGVIDSDYRLEWGVIVSNGSEDLICIKKGQAIAQVIFVELPDVEVEEVESLDETERFGGFGSTGRGI